MTAVVFDVGETLVSSSERFGVQKPAPEFFARLAEDVGRRGPWGHLHEPPRQAIRTRSLDELPGALP